jgi:hypothetical protein
LKYNAFAHNLKNYFLISEPKSSISKSSSLIQLGEGSFSKEDSSDFYNHLANKVAEKITSKSTFTNLFQPSEAATSTLVTLASPSTSGPSQFANPIHKDEDFDKFGKLKIYLN